MGPTSDVVNSSFDRVDLELSKLQGIGVKQSEWETVVGFKPATPGRKARVLTIMPPVPPINLYDEMGEWGGGEYLGAWGERNGGGRNLLSSW